MFVCSECGYKNRHNVSCCLICGSPLHYSTSILTAVQLEVDLPNDKFGIAIPDPDLELTLTIRRAIVSLPFHKNSKLILGRQDQAETDALATPIDPLHDRLYHSFVTGTPVILHDTPGFLSLIPFDAHQMGVSRRHVMIKHEEHYLIVEDLQSANGTRLNGQRLIPGNQRLLRDGDELLLGGLSIVFNFSREDAIVKSSGSYQNKVWGRLTG